MMLSTFALSCALALSHAFPTTLAPPLHEKKAVSTERKPSNADDPARREITMAHLRSSASPTNITYSYTTSVLLTPDTHIQIYKKLKSVKCGFAELIGAVVSDTALIGTKLYPFYDGSGQVGYKVDAHMNSPEKCAKWCSDSSQCHMWYYQYEYTDASALTPSQYAWMHKCQLTKGFQGSDCGSPFAVDTNDFDEYAGRVSAAGLAADASELP